MSEQGEQVDVEALTGEDARILTETLRMANENCDRLMAELEAARDEAAGFKRLFESAQDELEALNDAARRAHFALAASPPDADAAQKRVNPEWRDPGKKGLGIRKPE